MEVLRLQRQMKVAELNLLYVIRPGVVSLLGLVKLEHAPLKHAVHKVELATLQNIRYSLELV